MTTALRTLDRTPAPRPAALPAARVDRARVREFGVGYGNSSGYASARRYVDSRAQPRFRCG